MTSILLNNRYQVIQVLGAGGFGETFLAEDTHMPSRRRCVIKQLKPIANDPQTYTLIQQRFEREAATLEYLGESSDQIPRLHAYFSENGLFYLVQEWIHGETLTHVVETKGCQSETIVREILLSLLSVLDYVHSKGIIHRDIKPDNIILRSVDSKPVLIDFGAVKETIRTVAVKPGYPTQSMVIGTPGYMPSEQAIGRPVYATDIYSLGLTAIYLLTGKQPSELPTHQQTGEILWQNYAPPVSPQLAMVLNQAIKPQASDRYSTASKMLYALNSTANLPPSPTSSFRPPETASTQQTQAVSPPPKISPQNSQKPIWIVGGLIVFGLMAGIGLARLTRPQPSESPITNNSESPPSPISSLEPNEPPAIPSSPTPRTPPQQPINSDTLSANNGTTDSNSPNESPVITDEQPVNSEPDNSPTTTDSQPTVSPTPEAPPVEPEKPNNRKKVSTTSLQSVPAFPTGTDRSTVEATLGRPKKNLRGLWGDTRAVTYKVVPNQIDLGYLFDRKSGRLVQTEAAFAQSVDPQVMQNTLSGMLNGRVTPEIQQKLQQLQQGQRDDFSFNLGSVKGQVVRQNCDFIYISIWEADLHPIGDPSAAKQCS
ncbi:serine/threonine protein kinase [Nostoc sp. MBR 210]|uniref:non-specific serine/threonine protein kinase n=1 Tax=Nostoc spongiaeforme FACHB-130 TaxID=1357510 RepID=A0ABR8FU84_9NOSO|nr:protein kinase [Nostoc spongiaeforme]MBD2594515.1 protein kinase [Nostoc spongiaeforme FACHB-130]OCQ92738.1 serine/threonine protein kinase [Nostoc sp. MBR 210]